jgi:flagellin
LNASTHLQQSSTQLAQSLQRLSSGSKITSPADDSAGLAVAMKLTAQMKRIGAASGNIENAIAFKQTQDGYLNKVNDALTRLGELAMMALDITKTDADRKLYDVEVQSLTTQVGDIATKTFNGVRLFSTTTLNVTTDSDANTFTMTGINLQSATYSNLYGDEAFPIGDNSYGAVYAMKDFKKVQSQLAKDRAQIGSELEALGYFHEQLTTLNTNLSAANSRIVDVDVAQESTRFAKYNILTQAGTAMLAQANSLPQSVLKLLG